MGKAMQTAVLDYLDYRQKKSTGRKRAAASRVSVVTRMAVAWDKTNRSPRSIDGVWLEEWLLDLGVASNSLSQYESYIISFMEWAERRGVVKKDAWRWERNGESSMDRTKPFLWLPPSFFQEVIEAQDNWYWRGLFATMTYTLGRGIEIRERRLADLRLSDGLIFWPRTKTGSYDDFMPICAELDEELRRYVSDYSRAVGDLQDSYYMFPRYTRPFGLKENVYPTEQRWYLHEAVQRIIKPHIDPELLKQDPDLLKGEGGHTIRRSQARNLYESMKGQGVHDPLSIVQAMLGHKNRNMTEHYIGLDSGRQARNDALKGRSFFGGAAAPVVDIASTTRRIASGS